MDLGDFEIGFNVHDIRQSRAFYVKLGFEVVEGCVEDRKVTLQNGACRIALYQGYDVDPVFLNFREGDVHRIAHELTGRGLKFDKPAFLGEDGGAAALIKDPDGNVLYFCSHPGATRLNPAQPHYSESGETPAASAPKPSADRGDPQLPVDVDRTSAPTSLGLPR